MRHLTTLFAPLLLLACAPAEAPALRSASSSSPVTGVVSAADPRAAAAGMAMLKQGGSATDAAIAVMLALTVVEPQSSGIGGGGFYLRGTPAGEVVALDGRETAPVGATEDWFLDEGGKPLGYREAVISGLSVGVPGNLALAHEAHARYGTLEWGALFQPAIALAKDGFVVTERFRTFLDFAKARAAHTPEGRALFYDSDGEPLPVGTRVTNPALADSLEALAAHGPDWLHKGPAGGELATIVHAATPRQGGMVASDLASYEAKWREPVCGMYRQHRICGMGPPSSGATTVFAILKQLEAFDLAAFGPDSPVSWHLFAESQRLAYADRALYLADADFVAVPVAGLIDPAYLRERGNAISADSRLTEVKAGTPPGAIARAAGEAPVEQGTSHFSVVDASGNAVSYTSTIEGAFGSGLMFGGFYLNNELTDFSFVPERAGVPVANRVQGGKRPRSSMAPTLVYAPDGNLRLVIGAAGGGTIPVQVAKSLIAVIDWDMDAAQAIGLPDLYSPEDQITLEGVGLSEAIRTFLESMGHTVRIRDEFGKLNAIEWRGGRWQGAADPRSEGVALGQ